MEQKKKEQRRRIPGGAEIIAVCRKRKFDIVERSVKGRPACQKGMLYTEAVLMNGTVQTFRFDTWDKTLFDAAAAVPQGAEICVTARPSNYDFSKGTREFHGYDMTLVSVVPAAGPESVKFRIAGRLCGSPAVAADAAGDGGDPCTLLRFRSRVGHRTVTFPVVYRGSAPAFAGDNAPVTAEGLVRRRPDGTYLFAALTLKGTPGAAAGFRTEETSGGQKNTAPAGKAEAETE